MKNTIILTRVDFYRDGGTIVYTDPEGKIYYEDYRINTSTPGAIYNCYPNDDSANIIPLDQWELFVFTRFSRYYHQKSQEIARSHQINK